MVAVRQEEAVKNEPNTFCQQQDVKSKLIGALALSAMLLQILLPLVYNTPYTIVVMKHHHALNRRILVIIGSVS